tara:strand:- start:1906 stop:2940 length:1035 start_codon:yes stop_codon:yes gene_type:complete
MISKKFRAAVLTNIHSKLELKKVEFASGLEKGQVLVKLKYSGICGKQIDEINGIGGRDKYLPHLLGHEGSGTIISIGPKVKKIKKGDKVILHWIKGKGIQSGTPKYYSDKKKINAGWVTTFNEYAVVSENRVTKIPYNYSMKKAALFGCCATTSLSLVYKKMKLKNNDSLLIVGCGGLGQIIIQAVKNFNIKKIIAADINKKALQQAKKNGADQTIDFSRFGWNYLRKNIFYNKVVITAGSLEAIENSMKYLSMPGKCFVMGVPRKNKKIKINAWNLMHDQMIKGSLGGGATPDKDIPKFIKLDMKKKINLNTIIAKVIKFEDINKGIELFKSKNFTGRILIKF